MVEEFTLIMKFDISVLVYVLFNNFVTITNVNKQRKFERW